MYLNLSSNFDIFKKSTSKGINFKSSIFSGGEPNFRILDIKLAKTITITHRINSFNDLGLLAIAVDAIKRHEYPVEKINLFLPYFPGARQDRVCNPGEALTVKVYANMINRMGFAKVTVFDPHSDGVGIALDKPVIIDNHAFVNMAIQDIVKKHTKGKVPTVICPDAGANKKIVALMKTLKPAKDYSMIKCDKTRDLETGKLSGFEVYSGNLAKRPCVIVDDICDGGGTFMGLAEELKKKDAGDLFLVVSHGIFSRGFEDLGQTFKHIYYTDSIRNSGYDGWYLFKGKTIGEVATQIKLNEIL